MEKQLFNNMPLHKAKVLACEMCYSVRVLPANYVITLEYKPERINFSVDNNMIVKAWVG